MPKNIENKAAKMAADNSRMDLNKRYVQTLQKEEFGTVSALATCVLAGGAIHDLIKGVLINPDDLDQIKAKTKETFADCVYGDGHFQTVGLVTCAEGAEKSAPSALRMEQAHDLAHGEAGILLTMVFAVARLGYIKIMNANSNHRAAVINRAIDIKEAALK